MPINRVQMIGEKNTFIAMMMNKSFTSTKGNRKTMASC